MPYFSYISMLHLYESLGWWRAGAELRKVCAGAASGRCDGVRRQGLDPGAALAPPLLQVHFAEEWNEMHHLQIMESLGGDQVGRGARGSGGEVCAALAPPPHVDRRTEASRPPAQLWVDRFMAEHAAVFYYWVLVLMYLFSPSASYAFSELVEVRLRAAPAAGAARSGLHPVGDAPPPAPPGSLPAHCGHPRARAPGWDAAALQNHAVDTYAEFAEQNEELLRSIPPPLVALNYYKSGDLYLFDEFQTSMRGQLEKRRPPCK